eukprot:10471758-Ditylum_brightwellii.AAC.1
MSNTLNKRDDNNRIKELGMTLNIPYKVLDTNDIAARLSQARKILRTAQGKRPVYVMSFWRRWRNCTPLVATQT